MNDTVIRIAALCIVLASVETLHGIARATLLVPRIGKRRALKVSIVTGSVLAFCVCYFLVPDIAIKSSAGLVALGSLLAAFMAGFDIILGKLLMKKSWRKIANDFNPATGNYLIYGLALLVSYPWLVMWLTEK
jgi:hypothetical protein